VCQSSLEIAATWLALGLDTGRSIFYRQSDIPEIPELAWILTTVTAKGLMNRKEDVVKVIYYPSYLSVVDGLLNMNYYSSIVGCHLGVFPSYYESWGYTPLETAALGVQSITTDLSGFGKFMQHYIGPDECSIAILKNSPDASASCSKAWLSHS
jgi:glycosyltransferase involved in cell wall biosynthesis